MFNSFCLCLITNTHGGLKYSTFETDGFNGSLQHMINSLTAKRIEAYGPPGPDESITTNFRGYYQPTLMRVISNQKITGPKAGHSVVIKYMATPAVTDASQPI